MRISDWSSDVCSSDLQAARQAAAVDPDATVARLHVETAETTGRERAVRIRGAGGEVAIGAAERAVVPAGAVAAGAFAQVGRLGKVLRTGFQRVAVVVADETHHVGAAIVEVLAAEEGRRGLVHAAVVGARSEEHTSELQSLMRI